MKPETIDREVSDGTEAGVRRSRSPGAYEPLDRSGRTSAFVSFSGLFVASSLALVPRSVIRRRIRVQPMSKRTKPSGTAGVDDLDEGRGNVLFDVWLVSRATTALIDQAVRPSGLDADEFAIYSVLTASEGMTPTELARWMAAPATTVSSYVKRFERRGHVRRVANPGDGRSYQLELTSAGRQVHRRAGELFGPVLQRVTEGVGSGVADTHRRLRDLHRVLESVDHPVDQPG